ncbi:MAG: signal peptidase I [Eubacteriales bacterium]|nr:signal peptidase I [Eubacteriales bacterium]
MKEWIKDILIALVIAIIVVQFIKPTIVKESSMQPNFYENDYLFLSKQSYTFSEPERGDVIVFHSDLKQDNGKEKLLIKRIIGLPGDEIDIKDGQVYINGELFEEDYIKEDYTWGEISDLVVPEGQLFVMGDNRRVSRDSRELGCIKEDDVVGKAVIRVYPFSEFGLIK